MSGRHLLVLLSCLPSYAASTQYSTFQLDNGATVLYQRYREISGAFGTASASGNTIRRTMLDGHLQIWLAFEVHIDRKPGPGPIRFLLSMQPLGGAAFFGQKAEPREIENGDRVMLDVLEDPTTGGKIFDSFQVGIDVPMQALHLPRSIPHIPNPRVAIHIQDPQFREGPDVFAEARGNITGAQVAISVPDRGRFLFSSQPLPGYRMEAVVYRDRLEFVVGSDDFFVQCRGPLIEPAGSWYLWVRREPLEGRASVPHLDLIKK